MCKIINVENLCCSRCGKGLTKDEFDRFQKCQCGNETISVNNHQIAKDGCVVSTTINETYKKPDGRMVSEHWVIEADEADDWFEQK